MGFLLEETVPLLRIGLEETVPLLRIGLEETVLLGEGGLVPNVFAINVKIQNNFIFIWHIKIFYNL